MKKISLIISFVLLFYFANAQLKVNPYLSENESDISSSVTLGSTFSNYYTGTFLAPSIHHTVNSKLSLNYGGYFSRNSTDFLMIDRYGFGYAMPSSINTFYLDGRYQVNDKITITSTIVVEKSNYNAVSKDLQNFSSNMYMMGIEYKINDKIRLQAEIGIEEGQYPYSHLFSPYNYRPFNYGIKPFYSPFVGY